MRQFLAFLSITLKDALVYRARSFIWFLADVIPVTTSIFFFSAIFSTTNTVGKYSFQSILVYYLMVLSMEILVISHPEFAIAEDINHGFLATYLIRPLSYLKFYAANELAYKMVRLLFFIPFMVIVLLLVPQGNYSIQISLYNLATFLPMFILAFCGFYFLKVIIGFMAFWFTEIWWLIGFIEILDMLFSGLLIPLDLLPLTFQKIATFLPFKYFIYVPSQLFITSLSPTQTLMNLGIQVLWLVILALLAKFVWRKGLETYASFGN